MNNLKSLPAKSPWALKVFFYMAILLLPSLVLPLFSAEPVFHLGSDYVDLSHLEQFKLDIRYATTDNFTGKNLYGNYKACILHKKAAAKMKKAAEILKKEKPGWKFLIFDCLRPRHIQEKLWEVVVHTPQQNYVANPATGSIHNFGFALDLSLLNDAGREIDMGTPYDSFLPLAQPRLESRFLKEGKLSAKQVANRKILRSIMERAGFKQLAIEWWHYDALNAAEVRKNYKLVE